MLRIAIVVCLFVSSSFVRANQWEVWQDFESPADAAEWVARGFEGTRVPGESADIEKAASSDGAPLIAKDGQLIVPWEETPGGLIVKFRDSEPLDISDWYRVRATTARLLKTDDGATSNAGPGYASHIQLEDGDQMQQIDGILLGEEDGSQIFSFDISVAKTKFDPLALENLNLIFRDLGTTEGVMLIDRIEVFKSPVRTERSLRLPRIFGEGMVLQRDMPITIWGDAMPGATVSLRLGGDAVRTIADGQGAWRASLPMRGAGGPYALEVSSNEETVLFEDVLIGDVWICSGQSNMVWGINHVDGSEETIAAADYPQIRFITLPCETWAFPRDDFDNVWMTCSPETLAGENRMGFSAVGYFFGRELRREVGVPIGLIQTAWGGTAIQPWTPREAFPKYDYYADMQEMIEKADRDHLASGDDASSHPLNGPQKASGIYNAMVAPIAGFGTRGVIWYQGESNLGDRGDYYHMMVALIEGWREAWKAASHGAQARLPFYYVQIAPFVYRGNVMMLPELREAQERALELPDTGWASTMDIGDLRNIHPRNKLDVGKRLALNVLAHEYGRDDLVWTGPTFREMSIDGDRVAIRFDHADGGLTTKDGEAPAWFQLSGAEKEFHVAEAEIDGDSVIIRSDEVTTPVAVRFAYHQNAEVNLTNGAGLPAWPFRTDDWDDVVGYQPKDGHFLEQWRILGPFAFEPEGDQSNWIDTLAPEAATLETADWETTYTGKNGVELAWKTVHSQNDGFVSLEQETGGHDFAVALAAVYVHSPEEAEYTFKTGSDDGVSVRINGEEVYRNGAFRGAFPDEDVFQARLDRGWNLIMLKISENWGDWGFYFRIIDPDKTLMHSVEPPME